MFMCILAQFKETDSGPPAPHTRTRTCTRTHAKQQGRTVPAFRATKCPRRQDPVCGAAAVLGLAREGCWRGPVRRRPVRGARRSSLGTSPLGGGPPRSHQSLAGAWWGPLQQRNRGRVDGRPGSTRKLLRASPGRSSGASPRPPWMDCCWPGVRNGAAVCVQVDCVPTGERLVLEDRRRKWPLRAARPQSALRPGCQTQARTAARSPWTRSPDDRKAVLCPAAPLPPGRPRGSTRPGSPDRAGFGSPASQGGRASERVRGSCFPSVALAHTKRASVNSRKKVEGPASTRSKACPCPNLKDRSPDSKETH